MEVVDVRPDRYALSGTNWAGVPDAFALRATHAALLDVVASDRRRSAVVIGLLAVLIGGALLLVVVLLVQGG